MRKSLKTMVFLFVAILSCGLGLGVRKAELQFVDNKLLLKNIEALSLDESGAGGASQCPGPASYSTVGVLSADKTIRSHYANNLDMVSVYTFTQCVAYGIGKSAGNNEMIMTSINSQGLQACMGSMYHNSLFD